MGWGWGLALSGGGLMGAAHLGVLQAFGEWGLVPDVWSGASAGGLVAGVLAAGGTLPALLAYGAEVGRRPLAYLRPRAVSLAAELLPHDPLPPADSLFDSRPFVEGLVCLCPAPQAITQWRQPTALTAVDLAALRPVAFVRGPDGAWLPPRGHWRIVGSCDLGLALGATMAMPGVFSPQRASPGGVPEFLVDGGVGDELPVDWAVSLGADRVIAVDVARAAPGLPPRVGLSWVLGRSTDYITAAVSRLRRPPRVPVLTLAPETAGVPPWDFSQFGRLVGIGYAAALACRDEVLEFLADGAAR